MNDMLNEIYYVVAWQILRKLLSNGHISDEEYAAACSIAARQYRPLAVRE